MQSDESKLYNAIYNHRIIDYRDAALDNFVCPFCRSFLYKMGYLQALPHAVNQPNSENNKCVLCRQLVVLWFRDDYVGDKWEELLKILNPAIYKGEEWYKDYNDYYEKRNHLMPVARIEEDESDSDNEQVVEYTKCDTINDEIVLPNHHVETINFCTFHF